MDANQIIDALGGTTKVATLCEITEGAVSQWRSSNHIPPARLMYLKLLRPEVFSNNPTPEQSGALPNSDGRPLVDHSTKKAA